MFSMAAAVDIRFREQMRLGIRSASSCAIMPPMDTPETWSWRSAVQPRWSRSSMRSLAISEVEYRRIGLSDLPIPEKGTISREW